MTSPLWEEASPFCSTRTIPKAVSSPQCSTPKNTKTKSRNCFLDTSFTAVDGSTGELLYVTTNNPFRLDILKMCHVTKQQLTARTTTRDENKQQLTSRTTERDGSSDGIRDSSGESFSSCVSTSENSSKSPEKKSPDMSKEDYCCDSHSSDENHDCDDTLSILLLYISETSQ